MVVLLRVIAQCIFCGGTSSRSHMPPGRALHPTKRSPTPATHFFHSSMKRSGVGAGAVLLLLLAGAGPAVAGRGRMGRIRSCGGRGEGGRRGELTAEMCTPAGRCTATTHERLRGEKL